MFGSHVVGRSIRSIASDRKNTLFVGSHGSAEHSAGAVSLTKPCKLIDVQSHGCAADVMIHIAQEHPNGHLGELMPWSIPPRKNSES